MITVIVPAFNEEKLIRTCLESLIAQNPRPDEILIVDNSSKDNTVKIVEAVIAENPNVKINLIHEKKQGCHHARETGWRAAQGEVIVHVDADETFPAGWMAKIHQLLAEKPEVGAFGGVIRFENAPFIIWLTQVLYNRVYPYGQQIVKGFPYLCGGMTVVKRKVLEAMDGYVKKPDNQLDDYYLASTAHKLGFKLHYTPSLWVNHSLRRYDEGGLKAFFQWGVATFDTKYYEDKQ
jgi:glycosyltransferase involved in cell wall biosynthesis